MTSVIENTKNELPIAIDPRSQATLEVASKAAKTHATVFISGETGVGKELLAQYIHRHSLVHQGPFVSVNCAALPENMIEAILFGYEKGAFTNALQSYPGKFEQADNGTLLLDEISELPLMLQAKLLRVLQEREVERLGGKRMINLNVRIIAATNRDIQKQVKIGAFRSDLYYRLNVIPIHCGALRDRPLDIVPLANYLIEKHSMILERTIPQLTFTAETKLKNYPWPGNVREMENVIQRALILTSNDAVEADDLMLSETLNEYVDVNEPIGLKQIETNIIMDVLKETDGCRTVAAEKLQMSPRTLRYKISKLKSLGMKVP